MYKSCSYCGRIHPVGFVCPHKPKRIRTKTPDTHTAQFRRRKIWKQKSIHIRSRDLEMCRMCLSEGRYTFNQLSVHHIVPLEEDFDKRLDDDNLITLCSMHHSEADGGNIERVLLQSLAEKPPYSDIE